MLFGNTKGGGDLKPPGNKLNIQGCREAIKVSCTALVLIIVDGEGLGDRWTQAISLQTQGKALGLC